MVPWASAGHYPRAAGEDEGAPRAFQEQQRSTRQQEQTPRFGRPQRGDGKLRGDQRAELVRPFDVWAPKPKLAQRKLPEDNRRA